MCVYQISSQLLDNAYALVVACPVAPVSPWVIPVIHTEKYFQTVVVQAVFTGNVFQITHVCLQTSQTEKAEMKTHDSNQKASENNFYNHDYVIGFT